MTNKTLKKTIIVATLTLAVVIATIFALSDTAEAGKVDTVNACSQVGTIGTMYVNVPEYGTIALSDVAVYADASETVWSYSNNDATIVIDVEQNKMTVYDNELGYVGDYDEFSTWQE